jgi:hypothetical protein
MLCSETAGDCGKTFCYVCEVDWQKHTKDPNNCNMFTPQIKEKENEAKRVKAQI